MSDLNQPFFAGDPPLLAYFMRLLIYLPPTSSLATKSLPTLSLRLPTTPSVFSFIRHTSSSLRPLRFLPVFTFFRDFSIHLPHLPSPSSLIDHQHAHLPARLSYPTFLLRFDLSGTKGRSLSKAKRAFRRTKGRSAFERGVHTRYRSDG
jgi:hypothetical protein